MRVITSYTSGTTSFLPRTPCRRTQIIDQYLTEGPVSGQTNEAKWVCQIERAKSALQQ